MPLAAAWGRDGRALLVACKDGRLRVIDPDTMEVRREAEAIDGPAYSLAVAPGGDVLVGGHDGQLRRLADNGEE